MHDLAAPCATSPMITSDSAFLHVGSDVRLHLQTLDMLCATTGSRLYVFNRASRCLYASMGGERLLGLISADMIGKSILDLGFPLESSRRLVSDLGMVFAAGIAMTGENEFATSQGPRDCAYTLHPLAGADNEINAVVVTVTEVIDSTARRQAEQEWQRKQEEAEARNAQMRQAITETHHRIKNNLQMITAMIDMRAIQDPVPSDKVTESRETAVYSVSDLRRLSGCVRALAVVHDLLTHESKTDVRHALLAVRPLLHRLFPLLEETMQIRGIQGHIENVRLPARQCTSLALILNELISNALKHGRGSVEVTFKVMESKVMESYANLTVADDGPGFPAGFHAATAANTGLELIETLTRHDLGGTVEYANRPEGGGCVTIAIPLPAEPL